MKNFAVLSSLAALAVAAPRGFPPPITREAAFPSYNPGSFPTGGSLPPMPTGTGFPGGAPWPSIGSGALPTGAFPAPTGGMPGPFRHHPFPHHHHHEGGAPVRGAHFPSGPAPGGDAPFSFPGGTLTSSVECSEPGFAAPTGLPGAAPSIAAPASDVGAGDGHGSDGAAPQPDNGSSNPGLVDAGFHDEHHHHHHHHFFHSGGFPMPTGAFPPFPSGGFPMPSGGFPFSGLPSGGFPMPTGGFHHQKPTRSIAFPTPSPDHA